MPDTPTLGAIAYTAWWDRFSDGVQRPPLDDLWAQVSPRAQAAWEAAAQAAWLHKEDEIRRRVAAEMAGLEDDDA